MRLNPFNTSKIRVRSSGSGGAGGSRMPGGKGGGIGCGTLVIVAIAYFVFGADPMQTLSTVQGIDGATPQSTHQSSTDEAAICGRSEYAREACDALTSLNETWEAEFAKAGIPFKDPMLDLFTSGRVSTQGCGNASSASGPFYCPADMGIYIDTGFYDQLANMAGTGGDFARLYVIAHEYGHHIQNLTGLAAQVRSAQAQNPRRSNELQVRMELQADCYAGVWAGKNRNRIEPGDMEEGLGAAASIGDDTLQKRAGQRINPEGFTHGTSAQRMEALKLGLNSADDTQCDRYFQFN